MWNHHWMCVVYQVSLSLTLIFVLLYSCDRHKPSPGSKTGVSTEDNPAYGVSLNTPHKESGVTHLLHQRLCMRWFPARTARTTVMIDVDRVGIYFQERVVED